MGVIQGLFLKPVSQILPYLPTPPLLSYIQAKFDAKYYDYTLIATTILLFILLLVQTTAFSRPPRVTRKGKIR
jgi:hypothetical protein